MVSSTPRLYFNPGERPGTHFTGGWVGPRAGLKGGKSRPHRDSIPDRPARSQSLYRLSYRAHNIILYYNIILRDHCRICGPSLTETSLCGAILYVSTLSHKRYDFQKKFLNTKCVTLSTSFVRNISHSEKNSARYYLKCISVFT